ncbi:MAG: copper resistance protein B [Desulfobacterales bacterium]
MKIWMLLLMMIILPMVCVAAEKPFADPEDRNYPADFPESHPEPKSGKGILKYAEDGQSGARENFGIQPVHDNEMFAVFQGDRLEYQTREGTEALVWDVLAWIGSDYHKLYVESEGAWLLDEEKVEEAGIEVLYGFNIASFWDLQFGLRHDFKPEPDRSFAAFGVQGLAPYWFELDATAYVSDDGDVSAALEAEYDLLLSQRLILQPRLETGVAVQEVEENGVGQGITGIELGLRLRYEIRREFAPYIGVAWSRKLGETADLAEEEGEDINVSSFVAGVRFWF